MSSGHDSHGEHLHEDEHSHGADHSHGAGTHEHGEKQHGHSHGHDQGGGAHGHTHGTIDPSIIATQRGLWAIKWSFIGLFVTTVIQAVVVYFSGSVALLADTIHNLGDAGTAIPLGIAFVLGRRKPSRRFTYGYGRVEDLAGVAVVLTIFASAVVAGYESVMRFLHPQPVRYLGALAFASIIGFLGNEGVAIFRIKVGKEMGSVALVADGYHARVDGFASLSVLLSAVGVYLGYQIADPIIGILMTLLILRIVWESATAVFTRILDGVDPEVVDEIKSEARHSNGVEDVSEVRVRWLGHRMHAEVNVAVGQDLSVEQGHNIANQVRHDLLHKLQFLSGVTIHVDPANASGEKHHHIEEHTHDREAAHSH
ncbi:MAG TPA: cation diffusion facilitator family transporter [Pyrinomonadaceae bacterium]|nr:cation diffusion facilitator family transporter [Pyrinomonadaceae bacterium]